MYYNQLKPFTKIIHNEQLFFSWGICPGPSISLQCGVGEGGVLARALSVEDSPNPLMNVTKSTSREYNKYSTFSYLLSTSLKIGAKKTFTQVYSTIIF